MTKAKKKQTISPHSPPLFLPKTKKTMTIFLLFSFLHSSLPPSFDQQIFQNESKKKKKKKKKKTERGKKKVKKKRDIVGRREIPPQVEKKKGED